MNFLLTQDTSAESASPAAPASGLLSGRQHALDGLRTVAVAGVFLFHTVTGFAPGGSIGVDVFFALSGFVITLLILKEYRATGRLRLGVFYAKRLARLWPALLAVCAVVVIGGLVFPASGWGGQGANAIPASAYVMNLTNYGAFGSSTGGNALSPTWTLAVEEQFYLVWPVLLLLMLRFWKVRTVAWITAVLAAGFLVERFLLVSGGAPLARLYNGPDTRADQLLLGCTMALVFASVRPGSRVHDSLQAGARWGGPAAGLALVVAVFTFKEPDKPGPWFDVFWTFGPAVLALLAGLVIGSLVLRPAGLASRVLSHPWLANPGRDLSYAAYLWHLPVYLLLIPLVPSLWLRVSAAAALTVLMAYLSFRFVECPIRQWASKRLEPDVVRPAPEPARELEPAGTW
ncbi:acyltransferase [Pseudarthrobacter sp. AL07]|uniref:acyltransferase family protein n=1 Tax=unclassified Pseudarthrobacter TaxID=2647000 RepID=UPI00249B3B36|nr:MULTISPECIES: acyltransferase [unclassified Pseudarthrobacter]MDI3196314.1 acyltransferase [Pseudarthrobacter sp. AL20]MDI3210370.1 acyltransferase [Pseudarthrobacter sp. AL07]